MTSIGMHNITNSTNTLDTNITDISGSVGELLGELGGAYDMVGIIFLAIMAYGLYRNDVALDTSVVFMVPFMFVFGKFGLLPGGSGTVYGLLLGIAGMITAGIINYLR